MYDNIQDVKSKFFNTIVCYDGRACNVLDVREGGANDYKLYLGFPDGGNVGFKSIYDPDLNYREYNIGFANYTSLCGFWLRTPMKQYQQGLRAHQMTCSLPLANGMYPQFMLDIPLADMLEGKYPSFQEVMKTLKSPTKCSSRAFHKDFAVIKQDGGDPYKLCYKSLGPVGSIVGDEPKLYDKFQYLQEYLSEVMNA